MQPSTAQGKIDFNILGVLRGCKICREAKKLCKKQKIPREEPFVLKHYKDGEFNKDYDRKYTEKSVTNFMKDPTGDLPWDEDDSAKDVVHIPDPTVSLYTKKTIERLVIFMSTFKQTIFSFAKQLLVLPKVSDLIEQNRNHT